MGSVRRATWNQFGLFLALNVLVSAITVLVVLSIWDRRAAGPVPTATPTIDVLARVASAVPTATVTVPPSPTPVTYTVQPGDTLGQIAQDLDIPFEALMAANGLTDPNTLAVGQVLLIPSLEEGPATATPTPRRVLATPSVTANPGAESPRVIIRGAYERGNLETEYVYLENTGGVAVMAGWRLDDGEGNVYIFPSFTLYNGGGVNLYTQSGADSVINLYWGLSEAIWTPGKVITLRDASGAVHATLTIPDS